MSSLERSLQALNRYIKGGEPKALVQDLTYYDGRLGILNRDFYSVILDDPNIWDSIEPILHNLHIPKAQWPRYRRSDWTLSDFLAKLTSQGHIQVAYFLELIEKKKAFRTLDLLLGGMLTATALAGILSLPAMSGVLSAIIGFLKSTTGMPIIGMAFSGLTLVVGAYNNLFDKKKSWFDRGRDLIFSLANAAFTFAGYALWLSSFPSMPLVGAFLFVAASVVDAVKEMVCLVQEYWRYKNRDPVHGEEKECADARYTLSYKKHRNAALLNIATAIVLVGLIAVWSFAPAGLGVTLGIAAAIVVVCVVKYVLLKRNERIMRERLQEQLRVIEKAKKPSDGMEPELNLSADFSPSLIVRHEARAIRPQPEPRRSYHPGFFSSSGEDPDHLLTSPASTSNRSSTRPTL